MEGRHKTLNLGALLSVVLVEVVCLLGVMQLQIGSSSLPVRTVQIPYSRIHPFHFPNLESFLNRECD